MAKTRRAYSGNAASTTLASGISSADTTITITAATGWPSGNPFYVVIDPGTASEEKVLVTRSSTTLTVSGSRGADDTSAASHSAGATIYPVFTAVDANEANLLASTLTTQGDLLTHGASDFARVAIGTAGQVLKVNSGATAPEWGQVATAGIADSAVTSAKIADGTIVAGDIADGAITSAKILDGTIATGDLADGAVTSAKIADGTIVAGDIADGAVTSAKILDGTIVDGDINASAAIALSKLATGALPTGLTAGTTYYLRNVDGVTANLSATPAGAIINTSGTQSGTQSISELVDVPTLQNYILVSDTSRFVMLFGTTDYASAVLDPMLVRWSNQESVVDWVPSSLNQAGSARLSHGSEIVTAIQTRQEIVVFTDSSLYSLQYVGAPVVWSSQLLGDNISIAGQNAAAIASGVVFWMGVDKFYRYDGRVQTLRCDLRRHVFSNINFNQNQQIFAGTNEGFNEVWWFYCSADATAVDSYVVYNYAEDIWYYGSLARTAWIDSGLRDYPVAATYSYNLVNHEEGIDDNQTGTPAAITAYIESAEFDIDDGEHFGFVWRMVPDLTFQGSTAGTPQVTMTMYGMNGSGSGFNTEAAKAVARTSTITIEQFTNIVYTRIRGRQMIMKISSDGLGTTWQLGAPRIDIRPDGRR